MAMRSRSACGNCGVARPPIIMPMHGSSTSASPALRSPFAGHLRTAHARMPSSNTGTPRPSAGAQIMLS